MRTEPQSQAQLNAALNGQPAARPVQDLNRVAAPAQQVENRVNGVAPKNNEQPARPPVSRALSAAAGSFFGSGTIVASVAPSRPKNG